LHLEHWETKSTTRNTDNVIVHSRDDKLECLGLAIAHIVHRRLTLQLVCVGKRAAAGGGNVSRNRRRARGSVLHTSVGGGLTSDVVAVRLKSRQ